MFLAARAIFVELQPIGIVAAILFGGVIPLFAIVTLKCNNRADVFLLGSHFTTLLSISICVTLSDSEGSLLVKYEMLRFAQHDN